MLKLSACYARLCDLITNWNEKREKENLPETLEMLDLQLEKNFGMAKVCELNLFV